MWFQWASLYFSHFDTTLTYPNKKRQTVYERNCYLGLYICIPNGVPSLYFCSEEVFIIKNAKTGVKVMIILVLCLAAWFVFLFNIHSQEQDYSATVIEYDLDNPNYVVSHNMVIDGVYSYTHSGRKTFEGKFYISNLNMSSDMRAKITFADSIGKVTFYDKAGQPITTPVYQVVIDSDNHPILIKLFDQYTDTGGNVQGAFCGRRFICVETMSREAAIDLFTKIEGV